MNKSEYGFVVSRKPFIYIRRDIGANESLANIYISNINGQHLYLEYIS